MNITIYFMSLNGFNLLFFLPVLSSIVDDVLATIVNISFVFKIA